MYARKILVFALLCCGSQANAQSCSNLFEAIKRASRHCDFFCDQRELVPLQRAYEANCIAISIPPDLLPFENWPDDTALPMSVESAAAREIAPSSQKVFSSSTVLQMEQFQTDRD